MPNVESLAQTLASAFNRQQADLLARVIHDSYSELVKTSDFNELKEIVRNLAESQTRLAAAQERTEARVEQLAAAQERTEARVEQLAAAQERTEVRVEQLAAAQERTEVRVEQLAAAQERTEVRMEQLAAAQERTEVRMEQLAAAQERTEARIEQLAAAQERTEARIEQLAAAQERTEVRMEQLAAAQKRTEVSVRQLARDMGGLARSMAYSLENEAYRALPSFLKANHGIQIDERFVRTQLDGKEINVFARGTRDGRPIIVIGEAKLQLDERRGNRREEDAVLAQLFERAETARREYPGVEVVPVLLTHYARPAFSQRAKEAGVIVIQSFEW